MSSEAQISTPDTVLIYPEIIMPDRDVPGPCRCQNGTGSMSRRDLMGSGFAIAGLPGLCCTSEEAPPESLTFEGSILSLDLSAAPALAKRGSAVRIVDTSRNVNLIVVHSRAGTFAALERSCTHGGAQVTWNRRNETVQCTSWGHSEFALDGTVLGGSAKKPLRTYPVSRHGKRLRINLAGASA
jgi:nitrite reductase/ring-hydroxylating ferredoxin subunit